MKRWLVIAAGLGVLIIFALGFIVAIAISEDSRLYHQIIDERGRVLPNGHQR
jgi:hypothetical protein